MYIVCTCKVMTLKLNKLKAEGKGNAVQVHVALLLRSC